MKPRVVTARVTADLQHQIEFLKSSLGLVNTTSVLTFAIHALYENTKEKYSSKSSLELFKENGLIGCFEGPADLSTNYKEEISDIISRKQSPAASASKKVPTHKRKHPKNSL